MGENLRDKITRAALSAIVVGQLRESAGLGPDTRSTFVRLAEIVAAKAFSRILHSRIDERVEIKQSGNNNSTSEDVEIIYEPDYRYYVLLTFPDDKEPGEHFFTRSTHDFNKTKYVEEAIIKWFEKQNFEIARKLKVIESIERKLRLYPLDYGQKKKMIQRGELIKAEIEEIKEWIDKVERAGPEIVVNK